MPKKGRQRPPLCVTIDHEIKGKFDQYCEENTTNKSKLVERLISDFLKERTK